MPTSDIIEKVVLLVAGWGLSTATTILNAARSERRRKRKVLTRVSHLVTDICIGLKVLPAWRTAGGVETFAELFEISDANRRLVPPPPPPRRAEMDPLIAEVTEWEAERGKNEMSAALERIDYLLRHLTALHEGLLMQAEHQPEAISSRALQAFNEQLAGLKTECASLLKRLPKNTKSPLGRMFSREGTVFTP
jgi:hypothetical protein